MSVYISRQLYPFLCWPFLLASQSFLLMSFFFFQNLSSRWNRKIHCSHVLYFLARMPLKITFCPFCFSGTLFRLSRWFFVFFITVLLFFFFVFYVLNNFFRYLLCFIILAPSGTNLMFNLSIEYLISLHFSLPILCVV